MATAVKNKSTRKPAGAVPSSRKPAGRSAKKKGLGLPVDASAEVIKQTASVIPFVIKLGIVCLVGYGIYRAYSDRFIKRKEISSYGKANITDTEAHAKAEAIFSSVELFTGDFESLRDQFVGLNYNAVVKVYNAFGRRTGRLLSGDVDLFEFLAQQLDSSQLQQLRVLIGTTFF